MKDTITKKAAFVAGIIRENPVFVSLLGMCPTLATTKSVESAIGMGILVILVLIGSNVLISLLRNIIPGEVKIPCYIVVIATFVTIVKMLTQAFVPALYSSLGVFISLIVVNCIILGRAEAFASKHGPVASFMDAIGTGIGYTIALIIVAFIREFLGTGKLTFTDFFNSENVYSTPQIIPEAYTISFFTSSAGAFFTLGVAVALINAIKAYKDNKKKEKEANAKKLAMEAAQSAASK